MALLSRFSLLAACSAAAGAYLNLPGNVLAAAGAVRWRSVDGSRAVLASSGNGGGPGMARRGSLDGRRQPWRCGCWTAMFIRFVPACAPAHDHTHCETRLHGFALPLLAAAALHSSLDGWTVMAGQSHPNLGPALDFRDCRSQGTGGLALGVIARASLATRFAALAWCVTAQAATLLGAGLELAFAPYLGIHGSACTAGAGRRQFPLSRGSRGPRRTAAERRRARFCPRINRRGGIERAPALRAVD